MPQDFLMSPEMAKVALDRGIISPETYERIVNPQPQSVAPAAPAPAPFSPEHIQGVLGRGPTPLDQSVDRMNAGNAEAIAAMQQHPPAPAAPGGVPSNVTVEGGINVLPAAQRAQAWQANETGKATPVTAAASGGVPSVTPQREGSRDDVANGLALPTAPGAAPKRKLTADEQWLADNRDSLERKESYGIDEKLALQREYDAKAQGQEEVAKLINDTMNDHAEQMKRDDEFKMQSIQRAQASDDAARKRAQEIANSTVDQNRYWKELPTANKIVIGLASIFAGAAAGSHGRPNPVTAQLNQKMENDINAQLQAIQNKKDGWQMEQNVAAREYARDNDWLSYRSTKRIEGLGILKERIGGVLAQSKSEEIRAQGSGMIAKIDEQMEGERMKLAEMNYKVAKGKEVAAAQAAAAAVARNQKMMADIRERAIKYQDEHGLSQPEAQARALADYGINPKGFKFDALPTKEERAATWRKPDKEETQRNEMVTVAKAAFPRLDAMKNSPELKDYGLTDKYRPGTNTTEQAINGLNYEIVALVGPFLKDINGALNEHDMKMVRETFFINPSDSLEVRQKKLDGVKLYIARRAADKGINVGNSNGPAAGTVLPAGVPATVRK